MPTSWWQTDQYDIDTPVPSSFYDLAGPTGLALVKVWPDGRTDQGWGLVGPRDDQTNGFARRYPKREFDPRRVLPGYAKGLWEFAFVMRSVRLICIDIDGKNGGFKGAKQLGLLPSTLAEISKSGNGYHLFYSADEDWSEDRGFGLLPDRIGLEDGVDIRSVGCVYHHHGQRWNARDVAPLPDHLRDRLAHREKKIAATASRIQTVLDDSDPMEVLMMQHEILQDLAKPIPAGRRNNTLFAIGQQMRMAKIDAWDEKLTDRAIEVGLDADEAGKLVANIERYAGVSP